VARPGRTGGRRPARTDAPARPVADGFDSAATSGTRRADKPYAALALRGDYTGYLKIAGGQELFVSIKLGANADRKPPLVMLDGIAARYDRNADFEAKVAGHDQSIVTIYLPGQGETLARDVAHGGRSLQSDIEQEDQAKAVIGALDALGIKDPVGVAGLSYGGAIAAQCKKQFPKRFSTLMVVAPYVRSQGQQNPWGAYLNNPWNPWGATMYRSATKSALESLFPYNPDVLKDHPGAFHEGLLRLTMGLEDFDLKETVAGMRDAHFLVVPEDTASPPEQDKEAYAGVASGSFTSAPAKDAGKHDLVRGDGALVARWLADVMAGQVEAKPVRGTR